VAGLAVAGAVATKLFLWPLGAWLLLTGRRRAAGVAAFALPVLVLGAWAGIGFGGFREYPNLLAKLTDGFAGGGYSPVASAFRAGLPMSVARAAAPIAALVLIGFAARSARAGDERTAFAAAVTAGVFSSPIVWMHSMLILFVALAVVRPRFGAVWMLPLALWISETEPPALFRFVAAQCAILAIMVLMLRRSRPVPARLAPRAALPRLPV
jgi:hypothetical protein